MTAVQRMCVYAGSNKGGDAAYTAAAEDLARVLVANDVGIVFGGGSVGLMGVLADTALELGGEVLGVVPRALLDLEIAHDGLSDLRVVDSMHERKATMAELSDAFVALPGGIGTIEELIEVYTWTQLGFHRKPCALLNAGGYYEQLARFLDHAVEQGFLRPEHRELLIVADRADELLERVDAYEPTRLPKWLDRESI